MGNTSVEKYKIQKYKIGIGQTKYKTNRSGNRSGERSVNQNTKKIGQNIRPRPKERCNIGVDITSRDGLGVGGGPNCQEQLRAAKNCWGYQELLGDAGNCQ